MHHATDSHLCLGLQVSSVKYCGSCRNEHIIFSRTTEHVSVWTNECVVSDFGRVPRSAADHRIFEDDTVLAKIDAAELPESFTRTANRSQSPTAGVAEVVRRAGLFAYLLYGVLALVLVETTLAWWFGARTS